jgi:hypothetical protein
MKCHPMATNIFVKFKEQAANLASAAAWSTWSRPRIQGGSLCSYPCSTQRSIVDSPACPRRCRSHNCWGRIMKTLCYEHHLQKSSLDAGKVSVYHIEILISTSLESILHPIYSAQAKARPHPP